MEEKAARDNRANQLNPNNIKPKIEVGYIYGNGEGYIRIDGKRVFLNVRELQDLKADFELVLNHYYLRNAGYRITKK